MMLMNRRYFFLLIMCFVVLSNGAVLFAQSTKVEPFFGAENGIKGDLKTFVKKIYDLLLHGYSTDEIVAMVNDSQEYPEKKEAEKKETVNVFVREGWAGVLTALIVLVIAVVIVLFLLNFLPKKRKNKVSPPCAAPGLQELAGVKLPQDKDPGILGGKLDHQSSQDTCIQVVQEEQQRSCQGVNQGAAQESQAIQAQVVHADNGQVSKERGDQKGLNYLGPFVRKYIYDTDLDEVVVQQVKQAANIGLKLAQMDFESVVDSKNKKILSENSLSVKKLNLFDEIAQQVAYAKSIGLEPVGMP
ncbi:MAG: hypothetical protein ABH827_03160 [bacterium]